MCWRWLVRFGLDAASGLEPWYVIPARGRFAARSGELDSSSLHHRELDFILKSSQLWKWLGNSVLVSTTHTLAQLSVCSLAAYASPAWIFISSVRSICWF